MYAYQSTDQSNMKQDQGCLLPCLCFPFSANSNLPKLNFGGGKLLSYTCWVGNTLTRLVSRQVTHSLSPKESWKSHSVFKISLTKLVDTLAQAYITGWLELNFNFWCVCSVWFICLLKNEIFLIFCPVCKISLPTSVDALAQACLKCWLK